MTQEDRQLLFTDLCARLPYGVYVKDINKGTKVCKIHEMKPSNTYCLTLIPISDSYHYQVYSCDIDSVRPYLRPMSSMTGEEREELKELTAADIVTNTGFGYKNLRGMCFGMMYLDCQEIIDWFNKKMFDFRGLIPKGLGISTEVFNPYKD